MPAMESEPGKCPAKILLHVNSDYVFLARQRADKERHLLSQVYLVKFIAIKLWPDLFCPRVNRWLSSLNK